MNHSLISLLFLFLSFSAAAQNGGREVGNGGGTYVCRDQSGRITKAELLDLWETSSGSVIRLGSPMSHQIQTALNRLSAFSKFQNTIQTLIEQHQSITEFTEKRLLLTNDILPVFQPEPGCAYEQVAWFGYDFELEQETLLVNREIYESFTETDRAALYVHEAIYALHRKIKSASYSVITRKIVGSVFASKEIPESHLRLIRDEFQMNDVLVLAPSQETTLQLRFNPSINDQAELLLIAQNSKSGSIEILKALNLKLQGSVAVPFQLENTRGKFNGINDLRVVVCKKQPWQSSDTIKTKAASIDGQELAYTELFKPVLIQNNPSFCVEVGFNLLMH